MTIDQLNKLTDEEVRVRVALALGWRFADKPFRGARQWLSPDGKWLLKPWDYPADLNAAFTLVEKLKERGWSFILDSQNYWESEFFKKGAPSGICVSPNPARAICLSFLAVTEREEG